MVFKIDQILYGHDLLDVRLEQSLARSIHISFRTFFFGKFSETEFELISSGKIDVKPLITHKYSLDDSQKAFEHAKTGDNAMKIIIEN